jgi:hypothetical protein
LRSAIDWSYDLLEPTERHALDRLSVFAGGCDLAAADAVLAGDELDVLDVVDVLGQLVDKSLVVADNYNQGGVRYRLLESIRQYAQERLQASGDTAAVRHRHADHYVELAETAGPRLRSRDQLKWANVVARDTDNFRAVLDWAVEAPSPEHAFRLIAPFTVTGMAIGDAATDWAETAGAIPGGGDHPLFPVVAAWASFGATMRADFERAEEHAATAERTQSTLGEPLPAVLRARAVLAFFRGDLAQARHHAEEWVELVQASGDRYELAHALIMLAAAIQSEGPAVAIATLDEGVRVARDAGILSALSIGLPFLAGILPDEESGRALAVLDEAIDVGTQVGDRMGVSYATILKGGLAARRGEWRTALQATVEGAEQKLQLGDLVALAGSWHLAGIAFCELGYFDPAAVLIGKGDAMFDTRGFFHWFLDMLAATNATLLETLGDQQVATLAARGAALEIADAVAYLRAQADPALHPE